MPTNAGNTNGGRRPTLRDVGKLAGVSFKSVSRVVNDEPGVSVDMRARVQEAIVELGYFPDSRAQTLRSASSATATFGFLQADVRNPFHAAVLRGLEDVAGEAGYVVLSGSTDGRPERVDALLHAFVSRRVDGMVIVPEGPISPMLTVELRRGMPVVCVDIDPEGGEYDTILSDNQGGSHVAVRHLLTQGHRRIAFLGDGAANSTSGGRLEGYVTALRAESIAIDPALIAVDLTDPELSQEATRQLLMLDDPPTAVFSSQNLISYGALKAIHHMGLQYRVGFVGFDDVAFSDVMTPAVTVVPQDPLEMGRRAAEMLIARLADPTRPPVRETLPVPLIPRGSGEIQGPAHPMYTAPTASS